MSDPGIKTALIVTDAENFVTSFLEIFTERGRTDITSKVDGVLSKWDQNRNDDDDNIAIWIFRNADPTELEERLRKNRIWDRYFAPMFSARGKKGTVINILTPSSGEIRNLINYHRIVDGVKVDFQQIDFAALELEKKAKGQKILKEDTCKTLDLIQLSRIIRGTKESGGMNLTSIEGICGKNDRVSAFDKLKGMSGMIIFKEYIFGKDEKRPISNGRTEIRKVGGLLQRSESIQRKVEVEYRDRILRQTITPEMDTLNMHIALTGNPGTGKTTIARLMGEIYHELGLLSTGHVVKVTSGDLCAGYVGQTAIKTKERINEAMGGVLFIDEAYTLIRGGDNDYYGIQAIDTIVEAMTDHMGEFAVIIAGYPDDIKDLLEGNRANVGLQSRFKRIINIEDYSTDELVEIFSNYFSKQNIPISDELKQVLTRLMQRYYDSFPRGRNSKWANARTVLGLAETMRGRCVDFGDSVLDLLHLPNELRYLLEGTKQNIALPKKVTMDELRLPKAEIINTKEEIDIHKMEQAVLFIETVKDGGEVLSGTGFLISPYGHFLTCNHVIAGGQEITARVRFAKNGVNVDTLYSCGTMSTFEDIDIALLKLDGIDLPYLSLEKEISYRFEKGAKICLSGYPLGKRTAHDCTYIEGKISSTRKENNLECINLDISGKCGNSGGAVIDMKTGSVIGVFIGSIFEGEKLVEEINYMRPIRYFLQRFVV